MPSVQVRYGLQRPLFKPSVELDPLSEPGDADLLVPVGGFKGVPGLPALLKPAIKPSQPLFFLIAGSTGSGRTSLSNFIFDSYVKERAIPSQRFVAVRRDVKDYDKLGYFVSALQAMKGYIEDRDLPMTELVKNGFKECIEQTDHRKLEEPLKILLRRLSNSWSGLDPHAGFGLCIENVKAYDVIESAYSAFQESQAICLFTVEDYGEKKTLITEKFRTDASGRANRWLMELNPLTGADVRKLLDEAWRKAAPHQNPFDLVGVEAAFSARPRPLARVVRLLGDLLEARADQEPLDTQWPMNLELAFSTKEIRDLVTIADKAAGYV